MDLDMIKNMNSESTRDKARNDYELIGSAIKDSAIFVIAAVLSSIDIFGQYLEFSDAKSFYLSISIFLGLIALILFNRSKSQKSLVILAIMSIIALIVAAIYYNQFTDFLITIHDDPIRFRDTFVYYFLSGFVISVFVGFIFNTLEKQI